ncbi:hypothetical protein [Aurantimicrobium minutum]|uniref:hypothetical protein n=1 Tax=Aurantimicrobium minutum TaxID=708131 RepID=UPI00248E3768|nr:hypothetical protein [Aurantimicrobium minutum]
MSNVTPPPAPDASKRLNAPAPSGTPLNAPPPVPPVIPEVKVEVPPKVEQPKPAAKTGASPSVSINVTIPTSEGISGFKAFVEKRFRGIALGLSILTLFLYVVPFIGVLFAGYSLFFAISNEKRSQGKKKMLVWAIVLSSLGTLSALGMTVSFLGYVSN